MNMQMILAVVLLIGTPTATHDCQYAVIYGIHAYKLVDGSWIEIQQGSFVEPGLPVRFRGWVGVGPNGCDACCAEIWFDYASGTHCQFGWTHHWQYVDEMPTLGAGQTWEWISPTFVPETYFVAGTFLIDNVQSAGQNQTYGPRRTFFVPCSGDITGDLSVNVSDLLAVINNWGVPSLGCGDANHDGLVDSTDIIMVINGWGPCD